MAKLVKASRPFPYSTFYNKLMEANDCFDSVVINKDSELFTLHHKLDNLMEEAEYAYKVHVKQLQDERLLQKAKEKGIV